MPSTYTFGASGELISFGRVVCMYVCVWRNEYKKDTAAHNEMRTRSPLARSAMKSGTLAHSTLTRGHPAQMHTKRE
jgi:hypothetical protein